DINSPTLNFCTDFDTVNTVFPYYYEIDYVHVYQKRMDCETSKNYCNVNAIGYESKLYKDLSMGGSGCTANISTSHTSSLGVEHVLLQEGFVVDGSTNAYIDVLRCEEQTFMQAIIPTPSKPPLAETERNVYKALDQ
ncbi:MAG: hypothetical protein ACPGD8_02290, partial [Flavobacteriales bacterium]